MPPAKLIRIASALPHERALDVGSEKAALLVGYSEATPESEWLTATRPRYFKNRLQLRKAFERKGCRELDSCRVVLLEQLFIEKRAIHT